MGRHSVPVRLAGRMVRVLLHSYGCSSHVTVHPAGALRSRLGVFLAWAYAVSPA
ncbi:hypothetical protein Pma05_01700 [Plantactinospora mayteni]|uniref:Uncharacterized protein n=1 Tax=Plantactinospora mayteni TaxID=566021 RepID=A0ABQ4EFT8_9ACTN|nr:hypothetical protein Pma05_01700 [Plantactinospora mayteni]